MCVALVKTVVQAQARQPRGKRELDIALIDKKASSSASSRPARLSFTPTFRRLFSSSSSDGSFDSDIMLTLIDRFNSPPAQTLQALQPTSSTITYTVSTRSVPKTLPASVAYYAGILTRVLLGITSVLLLWIKWRVTQAQSLDLSLGVLSHEAERQLVKLAGACQWRYLVPSTLLIFFLALRRNYTGMSLPYSQSSPYSEANNS